MSSELHLPVTMLPVEEIENTVYPCETFDPDILHTVDSGKISSSFIYFADLGDFRRRKCFVKTKFHSKMFKIMTRLRNKGESMYLVGIQGIGKTTSILYYILTCIKDGDYGVHYVDLQRIEKRDKNLEKCIPYVKSFGENDCLVIDHVTWFNSHYVQHIKNAVATYDIKLILIETGFTAIAQKPVLDFGRNHQLSEKEFLNIWIGNLHLTESETVEEHQRLEKQGTEVYSMFKDIFVMTPKLLHKVFNNMFVFGRSTDDAFLEYKQAHTNEIEDFKIVEKKDALYSRFILHTRVLIHQVKSCCIYTVEQFSKMKIAINIFHVEVCRVTTEDMDKDMKFLELNLKEGDSYVRLSYLFPTFAPYWRNKLSFRIEDVLEELNTNDIIFQSELLRKEFERILVQFQTAEGCVISPQLAYQTSYCQRTTSEEYKAKQSYGWNLYIVKKLQFFPITCSEMENMNPPTNFKGPDKIVAQCAMLINRRIQCNPDDVFISRPDIENVMGVSYFVYIPYNENKGLGDCSVAKKSRKTNMLYMVQVVTGASHNGITIGKSVDIVSGLVENVDVHVMVVTACKEQEFFMLTGGCQFSNLSVLNLNNSSTCIWANNKLLTKFVMEFSKC